MYKTLWDTKHNQFVYFELNEDGVTEWYHSSKPIILGIGTTLKLLLDYTGRPSEMPPDTVLKTIEIKIID